MVSPNTALKVVNVYTSLVDIDRWNQNFFFQCKLLQKNFNTGHTAKPGTSKPFKYHNKYYNFKKRLYYVKNNSILKAFSLQFRRCYMTIIGAKKLLAIGQLVGDPCSRREYINI